MSSRNGAPGRSRRRPVPWRREITAAEEGRAPSPFRALRRTPADLRRARAPARGRLLPGRRRGGRSRCGRCRSPPASGSGRSGRSDPGSRTRRSPAPRRLARSRGDARRGQSAPVDRLRGGAGARARHDRLQARRPRHRRVPAARDDAGRSTARRRPTCRRAAPTRRRDGEERPQGTCLGGNPGGVRRRPADRAATVPDDGPGARRRAGRCGHRRDRRSADVDPGPRTRRPRRRVAASAARSSASCPTGSSPARSTKLNYDVLSTIAYFSVGADRDGNLQEATATAPAPPAGAAGRARA